MKLLILSLLFLVPQCFLAQENTVKQESRRDHKGDFPKDGDFLDQENAPKQEKPCDHQSDSLERFAAMRILPPAKILYIEPVEQGRKLEYKVDTKNLTKYGTFTLTKDTAVEPGALKKGKLVWILYSICDDHVYTVAIVKPEQIKK